MAGQQPQEAGNSFSARPRRDAQASPSRSIATLDPPPNAGAGAGRRHYERIPGPFDGRRVGLLETPVRLYDLSRGGCFVNSLHDQEEGTTVVLKIDLPHEGWITARAETVYRRLGFGFAVRFVEMTPDAAARLERSIRALQNRQPYDE